MKKQLLGGLEKYELMSILFIGKAVEKRKVFKD
jgi:hypothetical protein